MNPHLIDFIIQAKKLGYAGGTETRKVTFDDNSVGFEFSNDQYRYTDRYYGFNPFSGTEHVYNNQSVLVWKMNYFGAILPSYSDPNQIYDFLKEAMLLISPEHPFRGPNKLESGKLIYKNDQQITPLGFYGIESIHISDQNVYQLNYHGGDMEEAI